MHKTYSKQNKLIFIIYKSKAYAKIKERKDNASYIQQGVEIHKEGAKSTKKKKKNALTVF